jgi:hypothetical protein
MKSRTYPPGRALAELAAQHHALRGMMDRCEELADELDAGRTGPIQLTREVARLRLAFDAHNRFEEQLLRPALLAADAFGEVRVERMIEEHVGEHRAMRDELGSNATADLRAVIASLRAHLEAEERYFLSAKILRDDLVTVEGTG